MPRGNQLTRQWRLLQLIDRPEGITVDDASRDLGCAVRTIWRDLRVLEDVGFPIFNDLGAQGRRAVWRLTEEFRRRLPLDLGLAELVALLMSRELLRLAAALGPALEGAFGKLEHLLSRGARTYLGRMRDVVGVRALGAKLQAPAAGHLEALQRALLEGRRLRLRYYAMSRDQETERRVDPYHLTLFQGGFYLVAHCHLRQAVRLFAVERIREVRVLGERFARPADFDVDRYLAGVWGIVLGDIVPVRIVFSRTVARFVRDRLWHPSQRLRDLDSGRLEMTLRVADTLEVRRWILGYGPDAEVIEPAALREAIRRDAEALVHKLAPSRVPPAPVPLPRAQASAATPPLRVGSEPRSPRSRWVRRPPRVGPAPA